MRLVGLTALATFSLLAGCFSGDDNARPGIDAGPQYDAGVDLDATVSDAAPDAGPDVAPDAPVHDDGGIEAGPPPAVTVLVVNERGPEAGVTVVYQDALGAVLTTGVTDVAGRVSAIVPSGGQVTVVMGTPANIQLVTVEAVELGDVLTAFDASDTTYAGSQVSVDNLPDSLPPTGASSYTAHAGACVTSAVPGTLPLQRDCQHRGAFPLLVTATGGADAGYTELGYTYKTGNKAVGDGGTAGVSLANGAWSSSASRDVTLTNALATSGTAYIGFSEIADGVGTPFMTSVSLTDGGATATFPWHPGFPSAVQTEGNVQQSNSSYTALSVSAIATRAAADAGTSIDFSTLLPLINSAGVDAADGGPTTVSWGSDAGSLASADGAIAVLSWSASIDGGTSFGTWTFVAPPTATNVRTPSLPASLADWTPPASATFASHPLVVVVEGSFFSGYAQLRSQFASLSPRENLVRGTLYRAAAVPPLPIDGTLRMTAITVNGD